MAAAHFIGLGDTHLVGELAPYVIGVVNSSNASMTLCTVE